MQNNTNIESSTTDKVQQLISVLSGRNVEKLTNWKKEPTVEELMHDYRQAQSSHKYYIGRIQNWLKLLHPVTDKNKIKEVEKYNAIQRIVVDEKSKNVGVLAKDSEGFLKKWVK